MNLNFNFKIFLYTGGVSLRAMLSFSGVPCSHSHTHSYLEADQYNHSLICWPLISSTGAAGVKGLAQGHLSGGNEGGGSAAVSHSSPRFILPVPGIEPTTLRSQARFSNLLATTAQLTWQDTFEGISVNFVD